MIFLRVVFVAQLILMLPVFATLLVTPPHLGTVAIYLYLTPVAIVTVVFAVWQFIKHSDRRRLAAAIVATPVVCLGAPIVIYSLNGGPLPPAVLVVTVLILLTIAALVLLGKTDQWRGTGLFANKSFNISCLIGLGAFLLMLWFPIIVGLAANQSISFPTNIADRDRIYSVAALYLIAVGLPAVCLSLFTLLYAPVGLVRNPGGRLLHLGQLISALLLLATLTAVAFAVFIFMVNPG